MMEMDDTKLTFARASIIFGALSVIVTQSLTKIATAYYKINLVLSSATVLECILIASRVISEPAVKGPDIYNGMVNPRKSNERGDQFTDTRRKIIDALKPLSNDKEKTKKLEHLVYLNSWDWRGSEYTTSLKTVTIDARISAIANVFVKRRPKRVFFTKRKFAHLSGVIVWTSGVVLSALSGYALFTIGRNLALPFIWPLLAGIAAFALTVCVTSYFSREKIEQAISKFTDAWNKNILKLKLFNKEKGASSELEEEDPNKENEQLFTKENGLRMLISLASMFATIPLTFYGIHTPLMAIALKVGIAASLANPILLVVCIIFVGIAAISSLLVNCVQGSKFVTNCELMREDYKRSKNKITYCVASVLALGIAAAAIAIAVMGDVGGFRHLVSLSSASSTIVCLASVVLGVASLIANAAFILADAVYNLSWVFELGVSTLLRRPSPSRAKIEELTEVSESSTSSKETSASLSERLATLADTTSERGSSGSLNLLSTKGSDTPTEEDAGRRCDVSTLIRTNKLH